jgi:hypothetical protein
MKFLRIWVVAAALVSIGSALHALAPIPSLAGMVYHDSQINPSSRDDREVSIRLNPDGTASYIKLAVGNALDGPEPYVCLLETPPADGTYTYTVHSDGTATLAVMSPSSPTYTVTLAFTSSTAGTLVMTNPVAHGTFSLTLQNASANYPVINVSLRGTVSPGHPLSAGLVVPGTEPREFLIRVVGPSLAQFSVTNAWAATGFQVYHGADLYFGASNREAIYPVWSSPASAQGYAIDPTTAFNQIFTLVGAFPLLVGASDSATVMRLSPGNYTVVAATAASSDPGGDALIEIYAMP